ncbi:BPI fold-containing family B member 3 [Ornithorhynchus anatinus]|uniref:BPI fold-containing family B member 3 n=1 Tax=Ornithorhynchus anatinus TaxID=9258 RepID=UPI0019D4E0DF|nr:BPI fold-containing family B member 3 [Ornithorhynchus anatinus]
MGILVVPVPWWKMVKIWFIVCFCSLLSPSHGLLETVGSIARLDKDELEKAIHNSLVEGPLLQGVLGTVTSVNSGLIGSNGILGGGGLLSTGGLFEVLENLSGLKVEELVLPKVSLKLLSGIGIRLNLETKVGLNGAGPLGGLLQLGVEVNVSSKLALGVSEMGTPTLVLRSCGTLLGHVSIFSGLLPYPVLKLAERTLFKFLPRLLCPVVDSALSVVNELLGAVLCLVPMGALGSVEFTVAAIPLIQDQYIELDIAPIVRNVAGDLVDAPRPPEASEPTEPPEPLSLPPKEDHASQVTVPAYLFSAVFALLQSNGALDTDITEDLVPGTIALTTTSLASVIPEPLGNLPPDQQLLLTPRVKKTPAVTLQKAKATVSVPVSVEVLAGPQLQVPQSLFVLDSDVRLNAQLSPSSATLHVALSLDGLTAKLASSDKVSFDASPLEEWLGDVFRTAYVPKINAHLEVGIPLPRVLAVNFSGAEVDIIDNAVLLTVRSSG